MECTFYDLGRYFVASESGEGEYLVDVAPDGGCDCIDYRIRVDARGEKTDCKHLRAARERWTRDFPDSVRASILAAQKLKRKTFAPE
jgi:predicted nucleic acid-binding Zn finger protein